MIKSMTGYGLAKREDDERMISVEIKTLNSKFVDANIRLPKLFNSKEAEIKNLLTEKLERGKISVVIEHTRLGDDYMPIEINEKLFKTYFKQLNKLAKEMNAETGDIFKIALQYPDVQLQKVDDEKIEDEWTYLKKIVEEAIEKCDSFRLDEGRELSKKLLGYLENIEHYLNEVDENDPSRIKDLKERLSKSLEDLKLSGEVDKNRFEQEVIYYIEKLDISEEKVRLKSHIDYFREIINTENSQGKKLNFISQEMGREINTMGSKANYAPIQKLVVNMKDELEKIKEQLQNIV